MARRGIMPVAVALTLVAGCGGGESESARVRSVAERYFAGLASGNGAQVCSLLTGEARQQTLRAARAVAALAARQHVRLAPDCPGLVSLYHRALAGEPEALDRTRRVAIGSPTVTGSSATVRVQEPGGPAQILPLVRTSGGWRITHLRIGFADVGSGGPTAIAVPPPRALVHAGGPALARFYLGRTATAQSGCLACHLIATNGNAGPGPDLTHVGSALSPPAIERALTNPTEPMPSFRRLPTVKLRAIVTFLSELR